MARPLNLRHGRPWNYRHGESTHGAESAEWISWKSMWERCRNPRGRAFKNYGGRGIRVCERWKSFPNFLADMGRKPSPDLSIDRIDNDGNYEPGNCRWATRSEQASNRRRPDRRGAKHPMAKLSNAQVDEIRRLRASGVVGRVIAVQFGIGESTVSRIATGKAWTA